MDVKRLAERLELEEDECLELLELFLETSYTYLDKLRTGIDGSDSQQVVEAAHALRGSAVNLGLEEIAELVKGVEENARQNSLEGAAEAVKLIKEQCGRIAGEIG